jgi:hypothetical protein
VEIVKWIDGSTNDNGINKMILRPIEAGNMIEFCRGKTTQFTITSGALYSVRVVEETKKGFLGRKKQDLLLEVKFYDNEQQLNQKQDLPSILFNVEDNQVQGIMQYFQGITDLVNTKKYWSDVLGLPFLLEGESIIWHNVLTESKHATWLDVITNQRIIEYSFQQHGANAIALSALEDVIVMNQKRMTQSTRSGSYGRSKYHTAGTGTSSSTGVTIGNVVFVSQGRPIITFYNIQDPRGLVKLVKSISK